LVHVTLSPTATVRLAGSNAKPAIVTDRVAARTDPERTRSAHPTRAPANAKRRDRRIVILRRSFPREAGYVLAGAAVSAGSRCILSVP
jgi:hypothetical protein